MVDWKKWATYFLIGLIALFIWMPLTGQVILLPTSFEGFSFFLGGWFATTCLFGIPIGIVLRKVWGRSRGVQRVQQVGTLKQQLKDLEQQYLLQNPLRQLFTERKINELRKRIEELKDKKKKSHQS